MKLLLQHDFFLEDTGIKVELASKDQAKDVSQDMIQLWLRVVDPKKRKHQHKEDEAIQFDYNIKKDDVDKVAQEMVGCFSRYILLPWNISCLFMVKWYNVDKAVTFLGFLFNWHLLDVCPTLGLLGPRQLSVSKP